MIGKSTVSIFSNVNGKTTWLVGYGAYWKWTSLSPACFIMGSHQAVWPGGSWQLTFAAGVVPSSS